MVESNITSFICNNQVTSHHGGVHGAAKRLPHRREFTPAILQHWENSFILVKNSVNGSCKRKTRQKSSIKRFLWYEESPSKY